MCAWNDLIIEEFRANGGKVGGQYEGRPLLLLTTTGGKSGKPHTTPLVYLPDGAHMVILASDGGAASHPDWYHNLVVQRRAIVEVGTATFEVSATITTGEERLRLWAKVIEHNPKFATYQAKTTRQIPVILLQR